ncbi:MAG: lysophospholipid acyltransferase family protein [Candidatus Symbiothrix sp.]|jgi:KDO2-lipid IV(A) lauroyltransferase|nr:lysophospholipid acyltransferase family protein [Candidatus Symbiothrix sp.]
MKLLYFISDILYFLAYYVFRYRRKVVRKNLLNSFPDKDLKEIVKVEKKFYAFFCDYVVETSKLCFISEKEIKKRITFDGMEQVMQTMGNDKSCVLYLGHYGNWEWVSSIPLHVNKNIHCGQIYHPLENKMFDKLFLKMRKKFGAENITMKDTLRRLITLRREDKQFMVGFIADQVPVWNAIRHWLNFMNQDTPVFSGTERIARQMQSVAYYLDITRPKRGYYHCKFVLMTAEPQNLPEFELTDMYFQLLEQTIKRNPQYWLWTHNRWKRQRNNG